MELFFAFSVPKSEASVTIAFSVPKSEASVTKGHKSEVLASKSTINCHFLSVNIYYYYCLQY